MIRAGAYQATPKSTFNDRKQQILDALAEADRRQLDFLCFPEGFLTGYYAEQDLATWK